MDMNMDFLAQKQLQEERQWLLHQILIQAQLATQDGYFTEQQFNDIRREFGFSTTWNETPHKQEINDEFATHTSDQF